MAITPRDGETFEEFINRASEELAGDVGELADLDQYQAMIQTTLSSLDLLMSLALLGAERGQPVGAAAAMVRAHQMLGNFDHRDLSALLLTLMSHSINFKLEASDKSVGERLMENSHNGGMGVFTRFLSSGGKVCLHCGEDAENGFCDEFLDAVPCTCGHCDDEPV